MTVSLLGLHDSVCTCGDVDYLEVPDNRNDIAHLDPELVRTRLKRVVHNLNY